MKEDLISQMRFAYSRGIDFDKEGMHQELGDLPPVSDKNLHQFGFKAEVAGMGKYHHTG